MTSHAAVVARGIGKPCVAGCSALEVDVDEHAQLDRMGRPSAKVTWSRSTAPPGSVDARRRRRWSTQSRTPTSQRILDWADDVRRLNVSRERRHARSTRCALGRTAQRASGSAAPSTCSWPPDRLPIVREMILASTDDERAAALARLLPMQQSDFEGHLRGDGGSCR